MKKAEYSDEFTGFSASLSDEDGELITALFSSLDSRLELPKAEKQLFRADYEAALMRLCALGVPLSEAARRLSPERLSGFYARRPAAWYPLDSSAKVYPLSMSRNRMALFRLSAYLKNDVVPEVLQIALSTAITRFPYFAVTVRRGFFWHYLDSLKGRFSVREESGTVCEALPLSAARSPAFRVLYYKNRVSAEFFHILTDANGGLVFLKTLLAEYFRLLGEDIPCEDGVFDIASIPSAGEWENDFLNYKTRGKFGGFMETPALQMGGDLAREKPCRVIHFTMSAKELHDAAKSRGVSVTALVTALIAAASRAATDTTDGSIKIQIPVNLRRLRKSETMRNFSLYCTVKLPAGEIGEPESVLRSVAEQIRDGTSDRAMTAMINSATMLVGSVRYIPLPLKKPIVRTVYDFLGEKAYTNTLSNLGVVTMPQELSRNIEKLDFVLGTVSTNRAACALVSLGDSAVLSVTKLTRDPTFEERLYRMLTKIGLSCEVSGGDFYGD